eukprot:Amastigsp_a676296_179.p2 type:complete len:204 gc:universal Amastigsp_a676296_179:1271-660(-)
MFDIGMGNPWTWASDAASAGAMMSASFLSESVTLRVAGCLALPCGGVRNVAPARICTTSAKPTYSNICGMSASRSSRSATLSAESSWSPSAAMISGMAWPRLARTESTAAVRLRLNTSIEFAPRTSTSDTSLRTMAMIMAKSVYSAARPLHTESNAVTIAQNISSNAKTSLRSRISILSYSFVYSEKCSHTSESRLSPAAQIG